MGELDEYYILYFDVLGYCNKISKNEEGFLQDIRNLVLRSTEKDWDVTIRIFSDNVLVCKKCYDKNALKFLCHYAARIQELMLRNKALLLRGAITKGKLYIDDKFVYGAGLVDAVGLEEVCAKYPRIIISEKLKEEGYIKQSKYTILVDDDKHNYINFLNYYHPEINSNGERDENWKTITRSIDSCLNELNNYKLAEKKEWLEKYVKKIKSEYNLQ